MTRNGLLHLPIKPISEIIALPASVKYYERTDSGSQERYPCPYTKTVQTEILKTGENMSGHVAGPVAQPRTYPFMMQDHSLRCR